MTEERNDRAYSYNERKITSNLHLAFYMENRVRHICTVFH